MMGRLLAKKAAFKRRHWRGIAARLLAVALLSSASEAAMEQPVQVELVLAIDVSASVDLEEYQLQLKGIALAFRDPEILDAIKRLGPNGAAIAVTQWGGPSDYEIVVPFTQVVSAQDAMAFGFRVSRGFRFFSATSTSITTALTKSAALIEGNQFDGGRRVIDVSGDGMDNSGLDLEAARQDMAARRIVVNGLAIERDEDKLTEYFQDYVIIGPNSFVETADDYSDFARAIKAKLLRELQPDLS